ncbi:MAG: hypothetical protein WDM78_15995 [Puia sp.]
MAFIYFQNRFFNPADTVNDNSDNIAIASVLTQTNSNGHADETMDAADKSLNIQIRPVWRKAKEITRQPFFYIQRS